jgi:CO dehydrogenase maturation factor
MESLGGKKGLKERMSQPGVLTESDISIESIPYPYLLNRGKLLLVSIGKILQSLEGCACPMGVLSREFLKKLNLKEDELVIVDTEAGVEHFGRGVEDSLDAVLIVVEPSFESLELAAKIKDMAAGIGIRNVWAVLNKVPSPDIASKLEGELARRNVNIIGCIRHDPDVFKSSLEGVALKGGKAAGEIGQVLDCMLNAKNL